MKIFLVGAAFTAIFGSLALAGVYMLRGGGSGSSKGGHMMRALALRIAVSVVLFIGIIVAWRLGWIHPTGVPLSQ